MNTLLYRYGLVANENNENQALPLDTLGNFKVINNGGTSIVFEYTPKLSTPMLNDQNRYLSKYNNKTFSITLDTEKNKGRVFNLLFGNDNYNDGPVLYLSSMFEFVGRRKDISTPQNKIRVARLVFDDIDDTLYFFIQHPTEEVEGVQNTVINGMEIINYNKFIGQVSSVFNKKLKAYETKSKLLNNLDFYDTFSYLEAQVDILTQLLIQVLNKEEINEDLLNVLKEANKYSVINNKPMDKLIREFDEKKAYFRNRQETYYNNKY